MIEVGSTNIERRLGYKKEIVEYDESALSSWTLLLSESWSTSGDEYFGESKCEITDLLLHHQKEQE